MIKNNGGVFGRNPTFNNVEVEGDLTVDGSIIGTVVAAAGTLTGATLAANVIDSSLTSVGTLEFLTVTNTITGSINGTAATATSANSALTANTATTATTATTAGTVTTAAQPAITSVGTMTAVNTSGVITGTNTTASTSSTTGAVIVAGGVGIAKDSFINGHKVGVGLLADQKNLAIGYNTLNSTISGGIDNVALGYVAGQNITSGPNNVMLGSNAGFSNTTGQSNMCIGNGAHYKNETGSYNVAIGGGAGHEQNNNSVYNVFLGSNAGYFITSGNQTTCVGGDAGRRQADGTTNMTASSNSVYIGYNAKGFNNSDSNTIVIGANAIGLGANKTAIGTTFTTETKLFGLLNLPSGLSASGATLSGTVITSEKVNAITSARTVTVNFQNGNIQTLTGLGSGATGSSAIGFTGASATGSSTVTMIITNGGLMTSNTTFWSTAVKWPGGFKTTLSTSGVDILTFTTIDAGTNIYGMLGGKAFS